MRLLKLWLQLWIVLNCTGLRQTTLKSMNNIFWVCSHTVQIDLKMWNYACKISPLLKARDWNKQLWWQNKFIFSRADPKFDKVRGDKKPILIFAMPRNATLLFDVTFLHNNWNAKKTNTFTGKWVVNLMFSVKTGNTKNIENNQN